MANALDDAQKAKFKAHYDKCVAETKVDENLIKKMRANDFTDEAKLKEYVHCMFVALKFIDDKGEIQLDAIKEKIPSDVDKAEAEKVIAKCKNEKADSPKDLPYIVYKCYRTNVSKPVVL